MNKLEASIPVLHIRFSRLLDINTDKQMEAAGYLAYGRFAFLAGRYDVWFGDLHSMHPKTTTYGWYWAIMPGDVLLLSSRGSEVDVEMLRANDDYTILKLLSYLKDMRVIRKYKKYVLDNCQFT